jgi:hypothetical protein
MLSLNPVEAEKARDAARTYRLFNQYLSKQLMMDLLIMALFVAVVVQIIHSTHVRQTGWYKRMCICKSHYKTIKLHVTPIRRISDWLHMAYYVPSDWSDYEIDVDRIYHKCDKSSTRWWKQQLHGRDIY